MRIDDNSIRINRELCVACGICVDRCIMDNLRLSIAPCRQVCPVSMNCQGYIRLIGLGKEEEAVEELKPFGPLVSYIAENCSAPCESACTRKKRDGAVHILELKRYLSRKYEAELCSLDQPEQKTGKSVAVIGSTIQGLAAALKAFQAGHTVSVFSRAGDRDAADAALQTILESLKKADVAVHDQSALDSLKNNSASYDAIILSEMDDLVRIQAGSAEADAFTHQVTGNIFCCVTGKEKKTGGVYLINGAFETVESLNRCLNNEPLDWGRGLYTQGGAVKEFQVDQRVGSDVARLPEEEIKAGLTAESAKEQASRCFSCGRAFEKNQTCWYCLPCELECPHEALEVRIPYLVR